MDEIKPKRVIKWPTLLLGASVVGLALICAGADIYNNAVFGMQKSLPIAIAFIVAGAGLVVLPFMAKGVDLQVWGLVVVCVFISGFAGYKNHMASQRNHELAEQANNDRYAKAQKVIETAQKAYDDAKAEEAVIKEQTGSIELKAMADAASEKARLEAATGGCGKRCREAADNADILLKRLGDARAKEAATGRANRAQDAMTAEKAKAPAQARAVGESHTEELVMSLGLIALTIIGATLMHRGIDICRSAISIEAAPKAKKPAPVKKEAPAQPAIEKRKDIAAYIVGCTVACEKGADGEYAEAAELGAKFYADFKSWWAMHNPGQTVPHSTSFGTAMGRAHDKIKTKGQQHYYAKITDWRPAKPNLEKVA